MSSLLWFSVVSSEGRDPRYQQLSNQRGDQGPDEDLSQARNNQQKVSPGRGKHTINIPEENKIHVNKFSKSKKILFFLVSIVLIGECSTPLWK
jgi:hypothetical protein